MYFLITGLVLFFGIHFIPHTALKASMVSRLGAGPYQGIFALVALTGMGLMVTGMIKVETQPLWITPDWGPTAAMVLMLPAMILVASAHMKTNIKRYTTNPMLWGTFIWALAHLMVNSDWDAVLLFGGFAAFSLLSIFLSKGGEALANQPEKQAVKHDAIVVVAGAIAYVVARLLH